MKILAFDSTTKIRHLGSNYQKLRPASSNHGILPVEEEAFHKKIIAQAQRDYYDASDSRVARANLFFTNARGVRRSKKELTRALTGFVRANAQRRNPFVALGRRETPDGFEGGSYCFDEAKSPQPSEIRSGNRLTSRLPSRPVIPVVFRQALCPPASTFPCSGPRCRLRCRSSLDLQRTQIRLMVRR